MSAVVSDIISAAGPSSNRYPSLDFVSTSSPHDEYELIQRIGSGTYGDVYKARHIPTASMRALKVIKLEAGDDFNIIQQEILMMLQCSHPNIIAYFGSYLKRDKLWIAMELCAGGSMQDIYHIYGPLGELQIAYILKETLKGLDYLHKNGKMHRDVKGANILLTDDGHVKLADFGVAASITATICKRKSFIGTPYWMAPEVAAVERKGGYNHLCDIWAVGITAIEFAELQPPMFDLHPMRALFLMSKSGFKPPTLKDKMKWTVTFHNFVKYALTKNPKKRPSAEKLLEHPFFQANLTSSIARDLLDRLRNGATSNQISEDRDDDDDDRSNRHAPRKITSNKQPTAVPVTNIRPIVTNINQPPLIRSSILNDPPLPESNGTTSTKPDTHPSLNITETGLLDSFLDELSRRGHAPPSSTRSKEPGNSEHIQRLKSLGLADEDIQRLMTKLPLSAFDDLALNEIKHIVDVMRDADVEENEDETIENNTIKRSPLPVSLPAKSTKTKKKEQQTICENIDTNNNTLKSKNDDNTLKSKQDKTTLSNGIPSVPRVHMGAGFMKIFNECPLEIHGSYCWINNETRDQLVLIAAEEGVYSLNLNELHDATLELLYPRRTTWLFVKDNILWSISGKSNTLYRHDLHLLLHNKSTARLSLQLNKIQFPHKFEKLMPKKLVTSVKINNTRGCTRCCVGRNQFNGFIYLAGMLTNEVFLMQYYDPLRKFMHLKTVGISIPAEPPIFEMIFSPENQYAIVCIGVSKSKTSVNSYKFASVNFETEKMENYHDVSLLSDVSYVIQHEKDADTVLICHGNNITVVNSQGRPRTSKRTLSELHFDCEVRSLVCLQDSVLAFHEHGMQGRSLKDNEVTQEVYDQTRSFRVIGSDRLIVLQSRPSLSSKSSDTDTNLSQSISALTTTPFSTSPCDLHILMGHENS